MFVIGYKGLKTYIRKKEFMSIYFRALLLLLMSLALFLGFLNLFFPEPTPYDFNRLHIFLFNLCAGGSIILHFTEGGERISKKVILFLILAVTYAVFAFLKIYIPVLIITVILCIIVETTRTRRFSLFPSAFFSRHTPVSEKFHQASLLCLSMGLLISGLVILNNEYFHLVTLQKLQLDTFFLGFSFPLSLITMSLIFSLMDDKDALVLFLKNLSFWNVNLGVIFFFLFIIFQRLTPQVVVTLILFLTVIMIFYMFITLGKELQQKAFLISGISFLMYTAVTGILYILFELMPGYSPEKMKWLLRLHSFASLYGWNLCGLAIICRYNDFPLGLHSKNIILLHWITVILLAPLGSYFRFFAVCTTLCYIFILYAIFFTRGNTLVR
jgi:hypothetical protein